MSVPAKAGTLSATEARRLTGGTLSLLAGLAAIGTLSTNIILPSFPSMAAELGVEPRRLGITLSAFFLAFAAGQLVVGPLSDRFGRKRLVIGGLMVFIAGTLLCGMSASLGFLVAGRVVQALGVSAASVLSRAIARDLFEGEALARALSLTMIAMAAAPGFSPLLGSGLDYAFGWRSAFAFVGLGGVLLATCFLFGMGETHHQDRRAAHRVATVARAYASLAAEGRFVLPALAVGLIVGGLSTFFGATPAILIGVMGLSPLQLGLFFAATVFVVFGAGFLAPRLAHRWGAAQVAMAGAALALAGGVILILVSEAPGLASISVAIVIFLLGMGLVNPLGTALALQPFASRAGLASALLGFLQMVCSALGTALAASLPLGPVAALGCLLAVAATLAFASLLGLAARSQRTSNDP
ncbi:multidrug effflux MFS transporter [Arenibaculum pallidiluteum]|uniref:multidrug effflux MFS transporter n=1 Tax=Arenibaculum pallidiluteum TaxID=2812559 RepID=UPI001A967F32|nr:multidrug effflux MFS transporter [Arenibaculum pallidiluteum]